MQALRKNSQQPLIHQGRSTGVSSLFLGSMIDDQDVERQHGGQLFTQLDQLYRQVYVKMGK